MRLILVLSVLFSGCAFNSQSSITHKTLFGNYKTSAAAVRVGTDYHQGVYRE